MKYKAVIFDLFETLITEWGHKKYTKNEMCSDLGIEREIFDIYWNEKQKDRNSGEISFTDSIRYVCEKCSKQIDDLTLSGIIDKRIRTKAICFEYVNQDVYHLLDHLKTIGLRLAIISNCSSEEVKVIRQSKLYKYFDQVVLSCIFIGDGLSNELEGAQMAGMKAIQAKWYTNQFPHKRDSRESFLTAEEPPDILQYV